PQVSRTTGPAQTQKEAGCAANGTEPRNPLTLFSAFCYVQKLAANGSREEASLPPKGLISEEEAGEAGESGCLFQRECF
ncbi:MAG TPA: hypothetical protein VNM47_16685, partial [Terriglobia bacterium]|nr:hypothetical protein [Terriglobia bacterium]